MPVQSEASARIHRLPGDDDMESSLQDTQRKSKKRKESQKSKKRKKSTKSKKRKKRTTTMEPDEQKTLKSEHVHPSYASRIFGRFKDRTRCYTVYDVKKYCEIPPSHVNPTIHTCLSYHVYGHCHKNCANAEDHRPLTTDQNHELAQWCDQQFWKENDSTAWRVEKNDLEPKRKRKKKDHDRHPSHPGHIFDRFRDRNKDRKRCYTISEVKKACEVPPSHFNPSIRTCLSYHVYGRCMRACNMAEDHRPLTNDQNYALAQWCEQNFLRPRSQWNHLRFE